MTTYNYDEFSPADYDFDAVEGPNVGEQAPNFRLTTAEGAERELLDFDGEFLVLELGSITCPLFQSRRSGMEALARDFANVASAVLYVREAHPGALLPTHRTFDEKLACATRLIEHDGETRTVLIDGVDGEAHRAYGSMPNAVFIIDRRGTVRFRAPWNNPSATRKALSLLIQRGEAPVKSYFRPARPTIARRTLKNGGEGSGADFFKGLPTLIWNNVIKYNLRVLFDRT